jgi:hypothetical protein
MFQDQSSTRACSEATVLRNARKNPGWSLASTVDLMIMLAMTALKIQWNQY